MAKPSSRFLTRKQLVVVAAGILLLAIAYTAWSMWQWNSYNDSVSKATTKAEKAIAGATEPTDSQASANVKALRGASAELASSKDMCELGWSISWQTVFPPLADKVDNCKTKTANYAKVKQHIDRAVAFLDSEQQVLGILVTLKSTKELTDKNWATAIENWQTAASNLNEVQVSTEYKPILSTLQSDVDKAITAWQKLKKADKAENRDDYESAYDSLDQAITGMIDVADKSDNALQKLLAQIQTATDKL